jgi:DNA-binding transcriptional MerR regulator
MAAQVQDGSEKPDRHRGVYAISVAAELVGMGTQTLRLYERRGLLGPARSAGGTRRYSEDDLARLRRIGQLVAAGLNIAGVAAVLALESDNQALESDNAHLRARLRQQPRRQGKP